MTTSLLGDELADFKQVTSIQRGDNCSWNGESLHIGTLPIEFKLGSLEVVQFVKNQLEASITRFSDVAVVQLTCFAPGSSYWSLEFF
jgi:hypothetical protein